MYLLTLFCFLLLVRSLPSALLFSFLSLWFSWVCPIIILWPQGGQSSRHGPNNKIFATLEFMQQPTNRIGFANDQRPLVWMTTSIVFAQCSHTCGSSCAHRCQVRVCACFLLSFFVFFHFFALYRFCVLSTCSDGWSFVLQSFVVVVVSFVLRRRSRCLVCRYVCAVISCHTVSFHPFMHLLWIWVNDFSNVLSRCCSFSQTFHCLYRCYCCSLFLSLSLCLPPFCELLAVRLRVVLCKCICIMVSLCLLLILRRSSQKKISEKFCRFVNFLTDFLLIQAIFFIFDSNNFKIINSFGIDSVGERD